LKTLGFDDNTDVWLNPMFRNVSSGFVRGLFSGGGLQGLFSGRGLQGLFSGRGPQGSVEVLVESC